MDTGWAHQQTDTKGHEAGTCGHRSLGWGSPPGMGRAARAALEPHCPVETGPTWHSYCLPRLVGYPGPFFA